MLRGQQFALLLVLAIVLAKAWPGLGAHGGPLRPEVTVKIGAVALIFFISGITLHTREMAAAFLQWRIHAFVQIFTFVAFPAVIRIISPVITFIVGDPNIIKGLLSLSCMPPPVSSAVILTKAVGGNEAAAIFNSAFGSIVGVVVTPTLLTIFMGVSTSVPLFRIVLQLSLTVVAPFLLGQMAKAMFRPRSSTNLSVAGQACLLLIIYTTFCDAFNAEDGHDDPSILLILTVLLLVIIVQVIFMLLLFKVASGSYMKQYLSPKDVVCIVFCGVHKSLTLGLPMVQVVYGSDPHLASICLPLLIYHPAQIVLGGVLVPRIKAYVMRTKEEAYTYSAKLPI